jgi:hypothetical protein
VSIDFEDVAYEDSVSTEAWMEDGFLEEQYEDTQSGSLWSDPCMSYEEVPEEYYDSPDYPHDEDEGLNPLIGYAETEILF